MLGAACREKGGRRCEQLLPPLLHSRPDTVAHCGRRVSRRCAPRQQLESLSTEPWLPPPRKVRGRRRVGEGKEGTGREWAPTSPPFTKLKTSLLPLLPCFHSLEKAVTPFSGIFTCKHTSSTSAATVAAGRRHQKLLQSDQHKRG